MARVLVRMPAVISTPRLLEEFFRKSRERAGASPLANGFADNCPHSTAILSMCLTFPRMRFTVAGRLDLIRFAFSASASQALRSQSLRLPKIRTNCRIRQTALYREIAQYPATFLIDREGNLQPSPRQSQRFEKVEEAVGALLREGK